MNKLKVQAAPLRKAVNQLSKVISGGTVLRIFDNILFDVTPEVLTLTASDIEITMQTAIQCEGSGTFAFCISAEDIKKICDKAQTGAYEFEYTTTVQDTHIAHHVKIKTDLGKNAFVCDDAIDFARMPAVDGKTITINDVLLQSITTAIPFVSADTLRPTMTSVYFECIDKQLKIVATDANRLYVSEPMQWGVDDVKACVPKKSCALMLSLFTDGSVTISENSIQFTDGSVTIHARLIDGAYVAYQTVIPTYEGAATVDKYELLSAVEYAMISANVKTKMVVVSLSKDDMTVSAEDVDMATGTVSEPIEVTDNSIPDFTFGMDGAALISSMKAIPCNEVTICSDGADNRAIIFNNRNNKDLILQMPLNKLS